MKVGGPADLWVKAKTKDELVAILQLAHRLGIRYFVLAGGSNVIFPDAGWRGLIVHYVANKIRVIPRLRSGNNLAEVEAGAKLNYVIKYVIKLGLGGMNFLANIPGSVGGAVIGNAGCYGKEIKDVLQEVEIFNVKTNRIQRVKLKALGFAYRHSKLKNHPELVVLSATFKLEKVDKKQVLKEIVEEKKLRRAKHPQAPSCGSWFKNPSRSEPAWKFIEAAGMKGATVGGAKISNKHANFLINYRHATTADVIKLSRLVQQKVKIKNGISLKEEARIIDR